jgi:hypothetical protein
MNRAEKAVGRATDVLIVAYAGGGLGNVGDVMAFAPQACNDLPLHALVGAYLQAPAVGP